MLETPKGDARRPITMEDAEAGIQIAEWFGHEAIRFYGRLGEDEGDKELRELWQWICRRHPRGITARELRQGKRSVETATEAKELLKELAEANFGKMKKRKAKFGPATWEFIPK
jgi:hypothetical protein